MKTPTQEQFQKVIDTLEKANEMQPNAKVSMISGYITDGKTPMCIACWYGYALGEKSEFWPDFIRMANKMAKVLGFESKDRLKEYFSDNPEIWGNPNAEKMFADEDGYGIEQLLTPLSVYINHWRGVKERALFYA